MEVVRSLAEMHSPASYFDQEEKYLVDLFDLLQAYQMALDPQPTICILSGLFSEMDVHRLRGPVTAVAIKMLEM